MIAFLPDCPRRDEDELYRVPGSTTARVRCGECGWDSGDLSAVPVLPSEAAALVAKAAQEWKATHATRP